MVFALIVYSQTDFSQQSKEESQERMMNLLQGSEELGDRLKGMAMTHPQEGVVLSFEGQQTRRHPADYNRGPVPLRGVAFLEADDLERAIQAAEKFRPRADSLVEIRPALMLK